jgi:ATP-dependent helicase HrpA
LPRSVARGGVRGYPGLVAAGAAVDLRVFATEEERDAAAGSGLRRLLRLSVSSPVKSLEKSLDPRTRLLLGGNPDGSLSALLEDCADAAVDVLVPERVWNRGAFDAARQRVREELGPTAAEVLRRVEKSLTALQEVHRLLPDPATPAQAEAVNDIRDQLATLLGSGFVAATGAGNLADLTRYLTAVVRRLERLPHAPAADRERMVRVSAVQGAYTELLQAISPARAASPEVVDVARMIQEFRVSLWAQQLGTPRPVSEQRIYRAIDAVLG